jgi:hypothetical protein
LAKNGYVVLKGKRLKSLKEAIHLMDVPETDFGNIAKTPQLGVFDFRAFLNLAMLVSESDRAKLLRQAILDIVIDTINQRTGAVPSIYFARSRMRKIKYQLIYIDYMLTYI